MNGQPAKSRPAAVIVILACINLMSLGCQEKKDVRRAMVEGMCKAILRHPALSENTKAIAQKVIGTWNNGVMDRDPVLIYAGYAPVLDANYYLLLLCMSDEEFDIAGFRVTEFHKSDSKVVTVQENYPIFPENKIGHHQLIHFSERRAVSERKDEKDWDHYVALDPAEKSLVYGRSEHPVVWISLPNPPSVETEISIFGTTS